MTDYYRIRSPLSQITEERADRFIASIEQAVGEKMHLVSLDEYLDDDFALLYVASGGSCQMNTVFSWGTLNSTGLITEPGTERIE